MVIFLTNKSETNIQGSEHLTEDEEIGRLVSQLTEYEQELYEKDVYIHKLEYELRRSSKESHFRGIVR